MTSIFLSEEHQVLFIILQQFMGYDSLNAMFGIHLNSRPIVFFKGKSVKQVYCENLHLINKHETKGIRDKCQKVVTFLHNAN